MRIDRDRQPSLCGWPAQSRKECRERAPQLPRPAVGLARARHALRASIFRRPAPAHRHRRARSALRPARSSSATSRCRRSTCRCRAQVVNRCGPAARARPHATSSSPTTSAVVRHIADRVAVMYLGRIVEIGDKATIYARPTAPLHARRCSPPCRRPRPGRLPRRRAAVQGGKSCALSPPSGCPFHSALPAGDRPLQASRCRPLPHGSIGRERRLPPGRQHAPESGGPQASRSLSWSRASRARGPEKSQNPADCRLRCLWGVGLAREPATLQSSGTSPSHTSMT